jgi:phospho-N-acetylmuramoyl-pentapeptide-transferase
MIYHLAQCLQKHYSFFNVFHYISVRAIAALLSSLLLALVLGNWFIRGIAAQKLFRSTPREWTPDTHLVKSDTPTMGGIFILMVFLISTLLWNNLKKFEVWLFLITFVGFGLIGFFDDYCKIVFKKGISARTKFLLQVIFGTIVLGLWYFILVPNTQLCVPFFKWLMPSLGLLIIPWGVFLMVATSNAVNLTDGLDGLASGPLVSSFGTFSIIAYLAGHMQLASYLNIPFAGSAELVIIGATLVGAMLVFLWYNTYPAQVFMGDVGSLALGAALALMALVTRQELLLPMVGGIFVLETLSVIMQVASFKLLGRRIFRMAPIHHHFELLGWKETKITVRFWIISIVLSLFTLLTLKIR